MSLFHAAVRDVLRQKHVDYEQQLQQTRQVISNLEKKKQLIIDAFLEGTFDKFTFGTVPHYGINDASRKHFSQMV